MTVGIIGLGNMGGAYARNLIRRGQPVIGVDPAENARKALEEAGGRAETRVGAWIADCELLIIAVSLPQILHEIGGALATELRPGQVVLETGTFALADKHKAQQTIAKAGAILLDCPISGTGTQAEKADLVMMASGPTKAIEQVRPLVSMFTRELIDAGEFGNGSKLKYVANHAVALHNAAAAETLNYADASGLDREMVYALLSNGAGQSRMSDLRMPLMIRSNYEPATATMDLFRKDISLISDDIRQHGVATPIFEVVQDLYNRSIGVVPDTYDPASVFEVYRAQRKR